MHAEEISGKTSGNGKRQADDTQGASDLRARFRKLFHVEAGKDDIDCHDKEIKTEYEIVHEQRIIFGAEIRNVIKAI